MIVTAVKTSNWDLLMRLNKLLYLILFLVGFLGSSCNLLKEEDQKYAVWRIQNENYFKYMKDSADYQLYNIPGSRGGGSYYYKILRMGNRPVVDFYETTLVEISCRGQLINGATFANSFEGDPVELDSTSNSFSEQVAFMVRGLRENMRDMKVGEIRRIVLPQELGYGDLKDSKDIPPYSVTIWDIYLKGYF